MAITHTLVPDQLIAVDNIIAMSVDLSELSDGDNGSGMICNPADGTLICGMSDLATQPINGSIFKLNVKSQVDTKSTIVIRVTYDGGSNYIAIAEYTIAEEDDSSFTFATYDANSELGNTVQLNTEQVNNMTFLITNSLGIIHDLNVTIDDGTGGRIQIDGRVFFRQGRFRI